MKKIFTLVTMMLLGIVSVNADQVTYALKDGDTFKSGESVKVGTPDVVAELVYGEEGGADFKAAKANASVDGFEAFTEGNGTNGNKEGGTFYTIKPYYDGSVSVAVVLNADKAFYVLENDVALPDYDGITESSKFYGTYKFDVKGGKSYKVYCAGSKLGFYGFSYEYTPGSGSNEVSTIAELIALDEDAEATITLTNAQVNYSNEDGSVIAIQDASAGIVLSGYGSQLAQGSRLNGAITGKLSYNELNYWDFNVTDASGVTVTAGELEVKEVAISEVNDNILRLVKVTDAYYSPELISLMGGIITYPGIEKNETQLMLYEGSFGTEFLEELDDEVDGITIAGLPLDPEEFAAYGVQYVLAPIPVDGTGIVVSIKDVKKVLNNGALYDLNGRRVLAPQKGIYIQNGKKVVVK